MSPDQKSSLTPYKERLTDLWERMVRIVGIHTVNVLMERAIYQAAQEYPDLGLIQRTGEGLDFAAYERAAADKPEEEIAAAFEHLSSELLLILARLLGRDMAEQLAAELQTKMAEEAEAAEVTR
jgi:electron transfer flavoprotein alpha subunit